MKIVGFAIVFGIIGAFISFKNDLLYLGAFCCLVATISFFVAVYFWERKERTEEDD